MICEDLCPAWATERKTVIKAFCVPIVTAWMLLTLCPLSFGAQFLEVKRIRFAAGASSTTVEGSVSGYKTVDPRLRAGAGQTMTVTLTTSNQSNYFNVLPPGSETGLFIGSTSGNEWTGTLPADRDYTVRVYLMRNAARRNEAANYTLDVSIVGTSKTATTAPKGAPATGGAFNRTLELQGIRFGVSCANESSVNTLHIVPSGLDTNNLPIVRTIDGTVTGAEVADLNVDGSPEIYVYTTEVSHPILWCTDLTIY